MTMKLHLLWATGGLVALSACTQPIQPGQPMNNEQKGAITGALIGGVAGALADDDHRADHAAVGAIAGALVGTAIGSDLDRQAAALNTAIANPNVTVVNTGKALVVTMPQDLTFATDSASVRGDLQVSLANAAAVLNQYGNSRIDVIGHTDNTGAAEYNMRLSQQRADAVAAILMANGVSGSRISAYGRGETAPVATNQTPEGKARNRRVEIIITPR